jgi:tetratricopeptide (TPR) repeat protein
MAKRITSRDVDGLDRAQEIIYDAWDASTAKQRVALARKALETSPLCADAYILLAQYEKTGPEAKLDLLRRGVEAGAAALGPRTFKEDEGYFWGLLETRPYMRARHELAMALWNKGLKDEAIGHLNDMLRLNPGDNQGVRYILAAWLVDMSKDGELAALLAKYPDDGMAAWSWTNALASFRREGDSAASGKLLAEAIASNKHVTAYLLGTKKLPARLPPYFSPGEAGEAGYYAREFQGGWVQTPGAMDWLRANDRPVKSKKPR